jgi:hypothetical protein
VQESGLCRDLVAVEPAHLTWAASAGATGEPEMKEMSYRRTVLNVSDEDVAKLRALLLQ